MPQEQISLSFDACICGKIDCAVPFGLCHCGCGEKTSISTHNYRREVKGRPHIFRHGHHVRHKLKVEHPEDPNLRYIPLAHGRTTIVELADFEVLGRFNYGMNRKGYVSRCLPDGTRLLLHREIMGNPEGLAVDHINGDTLDNRRVNLRVCSHTENAWNHGLGINNTSGFSGVYLVKKTGNWGVNIGVNGKSMYLGQYADKFEAIRVRREAVDKYHAAYAPDDIRPSISYRARPYRLQRQPKPEPQPPA